MAAESVETFKRIMWRDRRPRLLRVLADECLELDRCVCVCVCVCACVTVPRDCVFVFSSVSSSALTG